MQILYCDCFSGISGDMFLASLLDAGMPLAHLQSQLEGLNLEEKFLLQVQKVQKGAVQASYITINVDESHSSPHRHLADIQRMIESSRLSEPVQRSSLSIFQKLGEAEANVHGTPLEEVHFHEVGAVDSILDIVGAAIGLEYFKIERLYASPLPLGSGQVNSQHGILPIPAPATLELLRMAHAQVVPSPARSEMVTPTGAAILATLATFEQPAMSITQIGIGAGKREFSWPNILRVILGESESESPLPMVVIETNIDDMNPQVFGHVLNHLFANGALDVYFTPIFMKKNRPATMLSLVAKRIDEQKLAQILLQETTTFGLRVHPIYRYEAKRAMQMVTTPYGDIPVKLKWVDGSYSQAAPEYEVCARLAEEKLVPLLEIYNAALLAGRLWLESHSSPDDRHP
jgi:pyridinium-3,5-bisthiocarboxylic acid mononucleotide nickel chelatase